ncbi:uncharacterized protein LOC114062278 [Empidonax traillii]|uniref:uncharacterized protein LOC114062278 n=1 Tax=Empidonax traillii TaxID=164674 RepID=UPI000FFD6D89|nr:uncharacterized protein LOC114062278 [Empidonax traillii]
MHHNQPELIKSFLTVNIMIEIPVLTFFHDTHTLARPSAHRRSPSGTAALPRAAAGASLLLPTTAVFPALSDVPRLSQARAPRVTHRPFPCPAHRWRLRPRPGPGAPAGHGGARRDRPALHSAHSRARGLTRPCPTPPRERGTLTRDTRVSARTADPAGAPGKGRAGSAPPAALPRPGPSGSRSAARRARSASMVPARRAGPQSGSRSPAVAARQPRAGTLLTAAPPPPSAPAALPPRPPPLAAPAEPYRGPGRARRGRTKPMAGRRREGTSEEPGTPRGRCLRRRSLRGLIGPGRALPAM